MRIVKSANGPLHVIEAENSIGNTTRLVGESPSPFGAKSKPGASYLWIGGDSDSRSHHLNREEVEELISHLQRWVSTGSLAPAGRKTC